jgi:glutamine amidotransferase
MIAVIDYGVGNLRSVQKAFEYLGGEAVITRDPDVVREAAHVVLPGVGAFGDAMAQLVNVKMDRLVVETVEADKPFLGICLGMQLLFEGSDEGGWHSGLGLFPGRVTELPHRVKVPHMGWNDISAYYGGSAGDGGAGGPDTVGRAEQEADRRRADADGGPDTAGRADDGGREADGVLFERPDSRPWVDFVHSFHRALPGAGDPGDWAAAVTEHGVPFISAIRRGNCLGVQFHPEKSGTVGLGMLKRFLTLSGGRHPESAVRLSREGDGYAD